MTQKIQILTLPVLAAVALLAERFVTAKGEYAAPGDTAIGVSESDANVGDIFPTIALGTGIVVAAGPINIGDPVGVGPEGKALTGGSVIVGRALQAAAADGDRIEVFLIPN